MHIETALRSMLRLEKKRRFKPNERYDFRHAAAALAYCDLFVTERPLQELVARPKLSSPGLCGCKVASSTQDAVAWVRMGPGEPRLEGAASST